jgi:hypothetical protein
MFNYNTIADIIPSHFFISTKNHVIFALENGSTKLSNTIMFYIVFLTLCSANFLLRLDSNFMYEHSRNELNFDFIFVLLLLS